MKIITNPITRGLTNSQTKALPLMREWLHNSNELFAILEGAAGTGKTYLINIFIKHYLRKTDRLMLAAPTNKAARVISKACNHKSMTVHKLLGFRPNFNLDSISLDNLKFESLGEQHIRKYSIVPIDEGSMIGDDLYDYLELLARNFNTKILFIGDRYQIQPVVKNKLHGSKNKISKVFSIKTKFKLTDIIRQERDNPMLKLLTLLQYDIDHKSDTFVHYLKDNPKQINKDGKGYIVVDKNLFKKSISNAFIYDDLIKNPDKARILTYTREWSSKWNSYIRGLYINEHDVINIEDFLVAYRTINDDFNNTVIINSDNYFIKSIEPKETRDGFYIFQTKLFNPDTKKFHLIKIVDSNKDITTYKNILKRLFLDAKYASKFDRASKWRMFYGFKDRFVMLSDININYTERGINKSEFIENALSSGYSTTAHKAQGSTISTVYIDLIDFLHYKHNKNMSRRPLDVTHNLLYTAISRASQRVIILK